MRTIVLGTSESRMSVEEFFQQMGSEEAEFRAADGTVLAYYIPTDPLQEELYAEFESAFLSDPETRRRLEAPCGRRLPGITTAELITNLDAMAAEACATP